MQYTSKLTRLFLGMLILTGFSSNAQDSKNLVKWNIGALVLKNFSFQYERAVAPKISVAGGLRFSPKSSLPFSSALEKAIDDDDTWNSIKDFKTANFAITPEVRFYFGEEVFKGFYIAPFVRYSSYSMDVPFKFDVEDRQETMPLSGTLNSFQGGILLGAQWKLASRVHLDWWIIGPSYGSSSGNIDGKKNLSAEEQQALRESLADLEDLPVVKTKYTVDENGAKVNFSGPAAGLRAGLAIGFSF